MKCVELNFFGMYGIQSQVDKKSQMFLLICKQVVTNMLMNCYVWYGVVRCGVVCGVVWSGTGTERYGTVCYGIVSYRMVWYCMVWSDVVWCGLVWYCIV